MRIKNICLLIMLTGILACTLFGCATVNIVGGPIPENSLKDGVYDGTASKGPVKVLANVTITNQRITAIDLVEHRTWKGGAAEGVIPDRIIAEQSTHVDAVSGATISSRVIMNAVEDAVRKAK